MKRFILLLPACLLLFTQAGAAKLQATFDYCKFYSPTHGPFIETYLSINGNSLNYVKKENGSFRGEVEVTFLFLKGDKVDKFEKYLIQTPAISDTSELKPILIDQQRILLENGSYNFEIQLQDIHSGDDKFKAVQDLDIIFIKDEPGFSDIQLYDSIYPGDPESRYTKSGYEFVPYLSNFFPEEVMKLGFYCEIYHSDKILEPGEKYLITYFIENAESGKVVNNYKGFAKKSAEGVSAIANSFYIKELPSGNYNLVLEMRNKENEMILEKKLFFQRSNSLIAAFSPEEKDGTFVEKFTDLDTLSEHIRSLEPISDRLEIEFAQNQLDGASLDLMQQYFLNFWVKRNPENPEQAWNEYYENVKRVNANYNTGIQKGYLTDRGFRYLKYGAPTHIYMRYNEPGKYPYEIWHYYQINGQANKRFVFWCTRPAGNDFKILHSDVIGEVKNPNWRMKLSVGNAALPNMRSTTTDHFGSDTDFLFPDR